ncbi:OmpA family protein [Pseudooceanicola sp. MF1-13]|uniref:OmpA family protein n=1 Tax=Pseudooceanicola sp. MF1-13 TaxID=3379095 RepID=UPI003891D256
MNNKFLKSTTAIVLSLSLTVPHVAMAQTAAELEAEMGVNTEGMTEAQLEELRTQLSEQRAAAATTAEQSADQAEQTAEQTAEESESLLDRAVGAATEQLNELTGNSDAEATADATAETPAADANAQAETSAEADAAPEAAVETTENTAEAAVEATEETAEAAAQATEETAEAAADATEETVEETADAAADAAADVTEETTADATAEAEATTAPADESAVTAETTAEPVDADAAAAADSTATADVETTATADSTETATAEATAEETEMTAEATTAAQAETEAAQAQEQAGSMAAQAEGTEGAQVVEQTLTEENTRSSSEEFETTVTATDGNAQANTQTTATNDTSSNNDGLDTLGKIALFGLGALAVGQILKNGSEVVSNSGDRVVVQQPDGSYRVLKNDDVLMFQPGTDVKTYAYDDGSTRTIATREDGTQIETIRAADGTVLRRTRILADGSTVTLFDDTQVAQQVEVNELPQVTDSRNTINFQEAEADDLRQALVAAQVPQGVDRRFSLSQVRNINSVRELVPEIDVDNINFETGSSVIRPQEAEELAELGTLMRESIRENPGQVFLIEGHTDAVGSAGYNLALSDRRAESVALALTEYFDVPPENMVVQGYGEYDLKVRTAEAERANRRAAVRNITPLLSGS